MTCKALWNSQWKQQERDRICCCWYVLPIAHVRGRPSVSSGKACNTQNLYLRPPACSEKCGACLIWWCEHRRGLCSQLSGHGADSSFWDPAGFGSLDTSPDPALQCISHRNTHSLRVRPFSCLVKTSEGSEISLSYTFLLSSHPRPSSVTWNRFDSSFCASQCAFCIPVVTVQRRTFPSKDEQLQKSGWQKQL